MEIPIYLAMTAAEFTHCDTLPNHCAWMACHFSPYGTGLSNLPTSLPEGSMIILNDRMPICGHDPQRIEEQLHILLDKLSPCGILLDFQRPDSEETRTLSKILVDALPCPVCVSELYARELSCPVFLPPAKLTCSLKDHLAAWTGREIWLEAALDSLSLRITERGCTIDPCIAQEMPHRDPSLHCHYRLDLAEDSARFSLERTKEDLDSLLDEATAYGVTHAVGLWQELN